MIQAQCQGGDGPVGDRVCCRSSTLREKEFEFVESRNVFFFLLHCRASTGHGRSTLEICESKKGVKLELLAGVIHRLRKQNRTKNKQHKQNSKQKTNRNQKRASENPRKKGETIRAPQASHLISSTL